MKTAAQIYTELSTSCTGERFMPYLTIEIIKQIQLDAYKAGMTEASMYADDTTDAKVRTTIQTARDRKESL